MQKLSILFVFVLVFVGLLPSQSQMKAKIYVDGVLQGEPEFRDSLQMNANINEMMINWINKGYLFAGIDSMKAREFLQVYLHKGDKYRSDLEGLTNKNPLKQLKKTSDQYANNGYPFASIRTDSLKLQEGVVTGSLLIDTGPYITYDSAFFFSEPKTNKSFIFQLLDINPGRHFSESDYRRIKSKLDRVPYLELGRPTDLSFKDSKAKVFLDVRETNPSSFQGVLGIQQIQTDQTIAVGNLELNIQNLFRSGKTLRFSWERFSEQSQLLDIQYKHPFFLGSKLAPSFRLNLLRQDTTFLTRSFAVGLHTFISPRVELFGEFERTNGTILSTELTTISQSGLADYRRDVYRLHASKGQLVSLEKFQKGIVWDASIAGGIKTVERNLNIPDSYYDSLEIRTDFFQSTALLAYQLKAFKRQSFYHRLEGGAILNDELLTNELFRVGGLRTLRGFNEKEIFASRYLLSRIEFRSFFEDASYAYVFYDQMVYKRNAILDEPFGLGLGFVLATSAGQFSFAMATGGGQAINFNGIKAHFGYISTF